MENTDETPEAITTEEEKRGSRRLGIKEFIITLIIIVVVWAARKCFNGRLLTGDAPSLHQPPITAITMPVFSEVIENVLIDNSTGIGAHYRAEYDKLFQQALEAEYAEKDN